MPHHFTKTTIEASIWCNRCRRETPWRIADGRRQFCLICYERPTGKPAVDPQPVPQQGDLFR